MVIQHLRLIEPQDCRFYAISDNWNLCELVRLDDAEADSGILLDLALQVLGELLVPLPGDYSQRIHFETAQALTVLVDAEPQATPDRLPPFALGLDVAQRAYLKDIGVVPPLAQRPNARR